MAISVIEVVAKDARFMPPDEAGYYCGYRKRGYVKRFVAECPCPVTIVDGVETYDKIDLDKWNDERKRGKSDGLSITERRIRAATQGLPRLPRPPRQMASVSPPNGNGS